MPTELKITYLGKEYNVDEYIKAIDPVYYTSEVIAAISDEAKIALLKELEYNYLQNSI